MTINCPECGTEMEDVGDGMVCDSCGFTVDFNYFFEGDDFNDFADLDDDDDEPA